MIHKFCCLSLAVLATTIVSFGQTRSVLVPVTPCRVVDTRQSSGPLAGPDMLAGTSRSFPIPTSSCGIPATASAYSLNVTVVPNAKLQYLTIWPTGQTQPVVSTLNSNNGQIIANAAIVPAGTSGAVSVYVTDQTNVIIDIDGYFTLDQPDTTIQSTAYGTGALANDTSPNGNNSAFGTNALNANTTGYRNTATGNQALYSNTTGSYNTASGAYALTANTTAAYNSAFGYEALTANTTGYQNTASGFEALFSNTSGYYNTASGSQALYFNTTGNSNTAYGLTALYTNTTGSDNTASGYQALYYNTTGSSNTASGERALFSNTTGHYSTASGLNALYSNTTGGSNTASGYQALYGNTTGSANTSSGLQAMFSNTTGYNNTASGYQALYSNTTATNNTAYGLSALYSNTTGSYNAALGEYALGANTTGERNTALGVFAGYSITTGNYNVDIANNGTSSDSGIIRIGTAGSQTSTYIAGITGVTVSGAAVIVNSNGQLGVASSSIKYKEDVQDLGDDTDDALMQLRPVSFRYKGATPIQYGLIAEEVDQIIPSLVARDSNGDPMSVKYHELPALLLSKIQRQQKALDDQRKFETSQSALIEGLEKRLAELASRLPKQ
jgi:hypothetical protein